jgi:hypothetical protein
MPAVHVAYILLAHTAPRQLARLVERLDGEHARFLVHVDRGAAAETAAEARRLLEPNPRVTFLPSRRTRRTTFGLVAAPLDALALLRRRGEPFGHAILLSGQDYPVKPPAALLERLAREPDLSYLHAFPIEDPERSEWPPTAVFRYRKWHPGLASPRWGVPLGRRMPGGRVPFGGSMYWALSRDAVEHVTDAAEREPELVRFFRHTFIPDEMFFQTLLLNSPLRDRVATLAAPDCYGLHYIDWRRGIERPETLGAGDLAALAATPAFFARKFDEEADPAVLDRIDAELLAGG